MSDKVGLILEADQLRCERDEALRERDALRDLVRAALQGTDLRARRESLLRQYPCLEEGAAGDE